MKPLESAPVHLALDLLWTEIQKLPDIVLRQRLTLTAGLLRDQLAGGVPSPFLRARKTWGSADCFAGGEGLPPDGPTDGAA